MCFKFANNNVYLNCCHLLIVLEQWLHSEPNMTLQLFVFFYLIDKRFLSEIFLTGPNLIFDRCDKREKEHSVGWIFKLELIKNPSFVKFKS